MTEAKKEFVPPRRDLSAEFWVGVFAIAGVACFGYLALGIAGMRLSDANYYTITAYFDNVSGLKLGAPVEIAGVEIGEVSEIALDSTQAAITLQIEKNVQLRDDDIAAIRTKGIIGDRYIKVVPGGSETLLDNKGDGKIADTESSVDFEEIIGKLIHSFEK